MGQFARIRQLRRDGLTIRQIAEQLHHSPKTILKALANAEPVPVRSSTPRAAPVFGPFREFVDAILAADESAPRKQRHTARQIHRRLVAEKGYAGQYDQVRRYLRRLRLDRRETFIPLEHRPGVRAESDFGHIHVDFPDGRRLVPVLLITWSYSNAPFAIALPTERTEAILHGTVEAFAFFGCVPVELWWDNPKTVAIHISQGRERTLHPRYAALASHYPFTPKFCLPATATEKPRVENRVFDLQRQWATPVPRVNSLDELNAHLRRCGLQARERTCGDNTATVGARFEQDRAASMAFQPPDVRCVRDATGPGGRVPDGAVRREQLPRAAAAVTEFPRRDGEGLRRPRGDRGRRAIAAVHRRLQRPPRGAGSAAFLVVLERKPAALDHALYRDWHLPAAFADLRREFEERLGAAAGVRHFIRVSATARASSRRVRRAGHRRRPRPRPHRCRGHRRSGGTLRP
ncbi:MAG: IS21 family transposase [Gemmataceae bacterium]